MLRRARPALGTLVDIAVDGARADEEARAIEAAFALVEALESQLSAHRPDSDLNRLCAAAHRAPQQPGAALNEVLQTALQLHQQSGGIFDVVAAACDGSSRDIVRDDQGLRFLRPLRIDLGGIAKGYVIDRVIELLSACGMLSARVNAGGDLRVFGAADEPVSLRFDDGFRVVAQLCDGAFAASRPGLRPMSDIEASHVDGRNRSVVTRRETIAAFADRAMIADALTKVALVCPATMDALCTHYGAQWRRYPFEVIAEPRVADAA